MKPKEISQMKSKQKKQFPILYENENEILSRSITKTDILGTSQSRLSRLSKSLIFAKKVSIEEPCPHDKFATLKFGDNKELLFNTDCQVKKNLSVNLYKYYCD